MRIRYKIPTFTVTLIYQTESIGAKCSIQRVRYNGHVMWETGSSVRLHMSGHAHFDYNETLITDQRNRQALILYAYSISTWDLTRFHL